MKMSMLSLMLALVCSAGLLAKPETAPEKKPVKKHKEADKDKIIKHQMTKLIVKKGQDIPIKLYASPSKKIEWKVLESSKELKLAKEEFVKSKAAKIGRFEGKQHFTFSASKPGTYEVTLQKTYPDSMKKAPKTHIYEIEVTE